jgi:hypothetical protein
MPGSWLCSHDPARWLHEASCPPGRPSNKHLHFLPACFPVAQFAARTLGPNWTHSSNHERSLQESHWASVGQGGSPSHLLPYSFTTWRESLHQAWASTKSSVAVCTSMFQTLHKGSTMGPSTLSSPQAHLVKICFQFVRLWEDMVFHSTGQEDCFTLTCPRDLLAAPKPE